MVHLITPSNLNHLRKLTPDSRIEPRRFRPNIILDTPGEEGFIEEQWVCKTLMLSNGVQLKIIQPTKRYIMTTLLQGDLPQDSDVLRTLARQNSGNFGVYAEAIQPGWLQIKADVSIID